MVDDLLCIKQDIITNFHKIVENMELKPFMMILNKYISKLDGFCNMLRQK